SGENSRPTREIPVVLHFRPWSSLRREALFCIVSSKNDITTLGSCEYVHSRREHTPVVAN
ncbi:MAG: hypothetical protein ACK56F_05895, partial [bacterium]